MSGVFANLMGTREVETRASWRVVLDALQKNRDAAGNEIVSPSSSMKMAAVFACVRVLSETVASLPLLVYRKQRRGKRRAQDHYLYRLLHDRPNEMMTDFEFREVIQSHLTLWGNAYCVIDHDSRGRVAALWPLRPDNMMRIRREGNRRFYSYQFENGDIRTFPSENIWHLRGLGSDGLIGYSPIQLMKRAVGLGVDAEKFGARFFQNDARPGIVLAHPGTLSDQAYKRLSDSWEDRHKGVEQSHRAAILEEGVKLHEVGIPPDDAQFIETRKFQKEEIAGIFRVPPHMIANLDRATFSNIEHQSIEFVVHSIRPWLVRWEKSIRENLFMEKDRNQGYYPEHLVDGLLRGDIESRYAAYAQGRQNGWLSANDIRELENMNPVDGGDVYLVPLNMIPAPQASASMNNSRVSDVRTNIGKEDRAASMRYRLRGSFLEVYRDTAARILRREINDIKAQARKTLPSGDLAKLIIWLDEFYRDHAEFIKRQMKPVNHTYGESIAAEAMEEIGEDFEMTPELLRFIESYTGSYANRHIVKSRERISGAIAKAQQEETSVEDSLNNELDRWEDGRSGAIAEEESTRLNNALAKTVFTIAGVQKIKSVAIGDSCVFCKMLDGKVIGINQYFLSAGEELNPDGAERPLISNTNKGHPPYHSGCDCMISVSTF